MYNFWMHSGCIDRRTYMYMSTSSRHVRAFVRRSPGWEGDSWIAS
jgi:hypothetical protein